MEVFLVNRKGTVNAKGVYNENDGSLIVYKGSVISTEISGGKFRSANNVKKLRSNTSKVKGNLVIEDMEFKSASAAANFVTGKSTNGLRAWKSKDNITLKEMVEGAK